MSLVSPFVEPEGELLTPEELSNIQDKYRPDDMSIYIPSFWAPWGEVREVKLFKSFPISLVPWREPSTSSKLRGFIRLAKAPEIDKNEYYNGCGLGLCVVEKFDLLIRGRYMANKQKWFRVLRGVDIHQEDVDYPLKDNFEYSFVANSLSDVLEAGDE